MTVTVTPFFNFLSPKWLCYKSSLTHPKCTKSHLQRSRFQQIFQGKKPPDPAFDGAASRRGRGWRGGGRGKGREGKGREKVRECGGARKVVCPGARAGSRRACRYHLLWKQARKHLYSLCKTICKTGPADMIRPLDTTQAVDKSGLTTSIVPATRGQ